MYELSGKGWGVAKTTRMLAQRQPSFKECVTAHRSMWSCAENDRGLSLSPKLQMSRSFRTRRGRGAFCSGVKEYREELWTEQKRLCRNE